MYRGLRYRAGDGVRSKDNVGVGVPHSRWARLCPGPARPPVTRKPKFGETLVVAMLRDPKSGVGVEDFTVDLLWLRGGQPAVLAAMERGDMTRSGRRFSW